jgi:hypothetical protein
MSVVKILPNSEDCVRKRREKGDGLEFGSVIAVLKTIY